MATISEHISALRLIYRKYEDDTELTDPAIYHYIKQATAVMNRRKLERDGTSLWNFNYYPMNVIAASPYDDDCIGIGCKTLRTEFKIPKALRVRDRDVVFVKTFDYKDIPKNEMGSTHLKYDPVKKDTLTYDIVNQYIVINGGDVNRVIPRAILVGGLWEDITEWAEIKACDAAGNTDENGNTCFDIQSDNFPIDGDYVLMMYEMVLKFLNIPATQQELQTILTNANHPS